MTSLSLAFASVPLSLLVSVSRANLAPVCRFQTGSHSVGSAGLEAHASVSLQSCDGHVNEHVTRAVTEHKPWHQWITTVAMIIVLLLLGI